MRIGLKLIDDHKIKIKDDTVFRMNEMLRMSNGVLRESFRQSKMTIRRISFDMIF